MSYWHPVAADCGGQGTQMPPVKIYGGQNGVFAPQISAVHFDLNHQTFDQDIYQ